MALSKSRSNFGGSTAALGSHTAAPVDEKFRTVQSIMEALLPKMILPAFSSLCRGTVLRSPRSCGKMILSGQRGTGGPGCDKKIQTARQHQQSSVERRENLH